MASVGCGNLVVNSFQFKSIIKYKIPSKVYISEYSLFKWCRVQYAINYYRRAVFSARLYIHTPID